MHRSQSLRQASTRFDGFANYVLLTINFLSRTAISLKAAEFRFYSDFCLFHIMTSY